MCVQEGTDGFKCECDLALCVRQNFTTAYKVFTKTTLPFDLEVSAFVVVVAIVVVVVVVAVVTVVILVLLLLFIDQDHVAL